MPDYSKGLIYMLRHEDDINEENIYIGSTTNFTQRKRAHKNILNNPLCKKYNTKLYKTIRENGGWEKWVMEWIEDYACNSKRELEKREGEITKNKAILNMCIAGRTNKEYYEDNKVKISKRQKQYRIDNKEKFAEREKKKKKNIKKK